MPKPGPPHIRAVIIVSSLLAALASAALVGWGVQPRASAALLQAREADDAGGWQEYLGHHPQGWDADEAHSALARLALATPVERPSSAVSLSAPVSAPVPAAVPMVVEDAALLQRLTGRIEQLKESIARFDQPVPPPVAVPVTATAPVSQPPTPVNAATPVVRPAPAVERDPRVTLPTVPPPGIGVGIAVVPGANGGVLRWAADGAIQRSTDHGVTWVATHPVTPALALDRHAQAGTAAGTLIIAAMPTAPILGVVSADGGRTWRDLAWPWSGAGTTSWQALQPAVVAGNGRLLVLAKQGDVVRCWHSVDHGHAWSSDEVVPGVVGLAPTITGSIVLVVNAAGRLEVSTTEGRSSTPMESEPLPQPQGPLEWDVLGKEMICGDALGYGGVFGFSRSGSLVFTARPGADVAVDLQRRRLLRRFADGMDGKQWFSISPTQGLVRSDSRYGSWNASRQAWKVQALASGTLNSEPVLVATGEQTVVISLAKPVFDLFLVSLKRPDQR